MPDSDFLEVVRAARPDVAEALRDPGLAVRSWLLESWRHALEKSSYVVFQAGPGYGKTVAAAGFCEDSLRAGRSTAAVFFRSGDFRTSDPASVAGGIAAQLARLLPGFEAELELSRREARAANTVDVQVGDVSVVTGDVSGSVTGVSVRVDQRPPAWFWERDLAAPLRGLQETGPLLIVLDGIDETTDAIRTMIADGLASLPPHVKVLATTRPGTRLPVTDPAVSQRLQYLNPDAGAADQQVIADWVRGRLLTGVEIDAWATRVSERVAQAAGGIFLYAYHVTTALLPQLAIGRLPEPDQVALPAGGLAGVYEAYLTRRFESRESPQWRTWGRSVLGLLAVSREPGLTAPMIAVAASLDALSVQDALDDAGQFLRQDAGTNAWSIWHRSFAEFLVDSRTFPITASFWHERLARSLLPLATSAAASSVANADHAQRYAVANVAEHVLRCDSTQEATALLDSPGWLEAAVALIGAQSVADVLARLARVDTRFGVLASGLASQVHCLGPEVVASDQQVRRQLGVWAVQSGDASLKAILDGWPCDVRAGWSSAETGRAQKVLTRHPGEVIAAAAVHAHDDTLLITAGSDGLVRGWSTSRAEVAFTWRADSPVLTVGGVQGDELLVLVGSVMSTTAVSFGAEGPRVLWSHSDGPVRASLILDDLRVVTSHADGALTARHLADGAAAGNPPSCSAPVLALAAVRLPERVVVVAGSTQGQCTAWDPALDAALAGFSLERSVASLAAAGPLLAAGTFGDSSVLLFAGQDVGTDVSWQQVLSHSLGRTRRSTGESVFAVQVSGSTVIVGDTSGRVHRLSLEQDGPAPWVAAHAGEVGSLLPAGGGVVSVGVRDGLLKLWSLEDIDTASWPEQATCVEVVGSQVAVGHPTGEISVRAIDSGELSCRQPVHEGLVWAMAWAGDEVGLVSAASTEVSASPLHEGRLVPTELMSLSGHISCVTAMGSTVGVSTFFSELRVVELGCEAVQYPPFGGIPLWLRIVTVADADYLVVEREVSSDMAAISGQAPGRYLQVWPRSAPDTPDPLWWQGWDDPRMLSAWTTATDDGVPVIIEGLRDGAVVLFDIARIVADPHQPASHYQRHECWPSRSPVTAVAAGQHDAALCLAWATLDGWLYVQRTREDPVSRVFLGTQVSDLRVSGDGWIVVGSTSGVLSLRLQ